MPKYMKSKLSLVVLLATLSVGLSGCESLSRRNIAAHSETFAECIATNTLVGAAVGGGIGAVVAITTRGNVLAGIGYGALAGGLFNGVLSWSECSNRFASLERQQATDRNEVIQANALATTKPLEISVKDTNFGIASDDKSPGDLVVKVDAAYQVLSNNPNTKDIGLTERYMFWLPEVKNGRTLYRPNRLADISSSTFVQQGQRVAKGKIPLPKASDFGDLLGQEWIGVFSVQNLKADVCSAKAQVFKTSAQGLPVPQGKAVEIPCQYSFDQTVAALNKSRPSEPKLNLAAAAEPSQTQTASNSALKQSPVLMRRYLNQTQEG